MGGFILIYAAKRSAQSHPIRAGEFYWVRCEIGLTGCGAGAIVLRDFQFTRLNPGIPADSGVCEVSPQGRPAGMASVEINGRSSQAIKPRFVGRIPVADRRARDKQDRNVGTAANDLHGERCSRTIRHEHVGDKSVDALRRVRASANCVLRTFSDDHRVSPSA